MACCYDLVAQGHEKGHWGLLLDLGATQACEWTCEEC